MEGVSHAVRASQRSGLNMAVSLGHHTLERLLPEGMPDILIENKSLSSSMLLEARQRQRLTSSLVYSLG
jgi:hypothetical protein